MIPSPPQHRDNNSGRSSPNYPYKFRSSFAEIELLDGHLITGLQGRHCSCCMSPRDQVTQKNVDPKNLYRSHLYEKSAPVLVGPTPQQRAKPTSAPRRQHPPTVDNSTTSPRKHWRPTAQRHRAPPATQQTDSDYERRLEERERSLRRKTEKYISRTQQCRRRINHVQWNNERDDGNPSSEDDGFCSDDEYSAEVNDCRRSRVISYTPRPLHSDHRSAPTPRTLPFEVQQQFGPTSPRFVKTPALISNEFEMRRVWEPKAAPTAPFPPPRPVCSKDHNDAPVGDKYCCECGVPVASKQQSVHCSSMGNCTCAIASRTPYGDRIGPSLHEASPLSPTRIAAIVRSLPYPPQCSCTARYVCDNCYDTSRRLVLHSQVVPPLCC